MEWGEADSAPHSLLLPFLPAFPGLEPASLTSPWTLQGPPLGPLCLLQGDLPYTNPNTFKGLVKGKSLSWCQSPPHLGSVCLDTLFQAHAEAL
jgi:hypothetical protein